jgi:outer membrane protein OmpA-like peptidoglycan-associated protein
MKHLKIFEEFTPGIENIFHKFAYPGQPICGKDLIYDPNSEKCIPKLDFINDRIEDGSFVTTKPIDKYLMSEVVNILFRCSRVFIDAYSKSFHSRYKSDIPKIAEMIDLVAREVKYSQLDRAKPAIESFLKFIIPVIGQTSRISAVNKKMWIESSEGRKWATDLGKFEVYCQLLSELESTESIQVKLDTLSSNIFFYGGETRIKEYSEKDIDSIVNILKNYPTIRVEILGWHNTTKLDPGSENIDLRRANAVKVMLASKGIDESRMTAEGKGESKIVPTDIYGKNEHGDLFNKNMRVDIKIVK